MLVAFARHADGTIEQFDSVDGVARAWSQDGTAAWVDLEEPTPEEMRRIGEAFQLDGEAIDDCLHGQQRPRIDELEHSIFLVLYGVPVGGGTPELAFRKLAAFCGSRFLVTAHREPLSTITAVRERCGRHASQLLGRGVDFILYTIIDDMADRYLLAAEAYEERLDELEEVSTDPAAGESLLPALSELRRDLLELRRIAASQRDLLMPVAKGEYDFISEPLATRFMHVRDHLTKAVEIVDGLRELLNGIRDNYHSALAARMNAIMKTLTVFATIMLPLSLVSGIYGMNLAVWPPSEHPASFWIVLGVMAAIAGGLLAYFRRQRLL